MWQVSFLHPWALWLAGGAVIPLLIHLLWREKPRQVRFTATRFIRTSRRRAFRRTQLKHLLLLLLRMALIALFALLLARPFLHRGAAAAPEGGVAGTPAAAIVLDDSMSMTYRVGDATWFDGARNRALELADRLRPDTATAVLSTGRPAGRLQRDRPAVVSRLRGLRAGLGSSSCWSALERAAALLQEKGAGSRDIYLFTDMTTGAWVGRGRRRVDLGQDVRVHVIDVAPEGGANGAVADLNSDGQPTIRGARLDLRARVLSSGQSLRRTVEFSFDGETVERRRVDLQAGEETVLEFSVPLREGRHHRGRMGFVNPDALDADDARYFTLEVAPDIPVLAVEAEPSADVESPSYFLRLALQPWRGREGMFRVERISSSRLEAASLGPYDVVVLAGAGELSERAWTRLAAYVKGGGGLLAFAGPEAGQAYHGEAARAVLPARVGPVAAAPREEPFAMRILRPDHPLLEAVRASRANLGRVRLRRCRRLTPAEGADQLLSLGPELPAFVLREGAGRTALFAGPPDDRWGRFATAPVFVPFVHETVLYLAQRRMGGLTTYLVGSQVPINYQPGRWPTVVRVAAPGSETGERLLPGATPGRLTYWKTDRPGYYRVSFERQEETWQSGFAVNTVPIESRLEKVPFEEVSDAIRAGTVEQMGDLQLEAGSGAPAAGAREVTPWVILLALAALVAELFLSNRFYRS
ncbi:MAG: vWA domain-containing protein [Planctomycetota bacterium]